MTKPTEEQPVFSRDLRAKRPEGVFSMFLGPVLSVEMAPPPRPAARPREKEISIRRGAHVSPHIVDLASASSIMAPRPELDFEQKAAYFVHRLKSAILPDADESRVKKPVRAAGPVLKAAAAAELKQMSEARARLEANVKKLEALMLPRSAEGDYRIQPSAWKTSHERADMPAARTPDSQDGQARAEAPVTENRQAKAKNNRVKPGAIRTPFDEIESANLLSPARAPWWRPAAGFAMMAVAVTLPVHMLASYTGILDDAGQVSAQTEEAFRQLKAAGDAALSLDPEAAETFDRAAATFAETRSRLRSATLALAAFASGNGGKFRSGDRLLAAGEALSKAGAAVSDAFDGLERSEDAPLADKLKTLFKALDAAEPHLNEAVRELDAVPASTVPAEARAFFENVRADLRTVRDNTHRFIASSDLVLTVLGAEHKRRYLVVFQNDRELRPTGGFIGSFALMDIEDGEIMNVEIPAGGSYDLRWGLNERLAAPEALHLVNTRWEFQDSNWFADFPTSARTLSWFYEKSGGPTIDGIVAVDTRLMETLLSLLGPVDMPEYGKTVTAENFFIETQKAVEIEYDKEANRPKQFISDMAPKVLERLLGAGQDKLGSLMNSLSEALIRKDVQVWFRDEKEQRTASDYGWTGELKGLPDADFLAVVDTNIAGGKTDGVVSADIRHETEIMPDGQMVNTVRIRRTHAGKRGDLFTGIKNIDYLRLYVPAGSELMAADGFERPGEGYFMKPDETLKAPTMLEAVEGKALVDEKSGTRITQESGFTVFANWVQLEPGESRAVMLRYRLPHRFDRFTSQPRTWWEELKEKAGAFAPTAELKLVVKRQAGTAGRAFSTALRLPPGWAVKSRVPEETSAPLERDLYFGTILIKAE